MEISRFILSLALWWLSVECGAEIENGWFEEDGFVSGSEGSKMTTRTVIQCSTRCLLDLRCIGYLYFEHEEKENCAFIHDATENTKIFSPEQNALVYKRVTSARLSTTSVATSYTQSTTPIPGAPTTTSGTQATNLSGTTTPGNQVSTISGTTTSGTQATTLSGTTTSGNQVSTISGIQTMPPSGTAPSGMPTTT